MDEPPHAATLSLYRSLTALRHAEPELADPRLDRVEVQFDEDERWLVVHRGSLRVVINVGAEPARVPVAAGEILLATGPVDSAVDWLVLGPETAVIARARLASVLASLQSDTPRYLLHRGQEC